MSVNFELGKEADFIVLNIHATLLMTTRTQDFPTQLLEDLAEKVFGLMMLGDDRAVQAVYIAGLAHSLETV